jgi:phthiocerol/phenolphthiocerol synthesis type-I polyketide synthase E
MSESAITGALIELWQEALGLDSVDADDDFFDLGGNSITAIRLIPLIAERLGVEPDVTDIFENPTPRSLADVLAGTAAKSA